MKSNYETIYWIIISRTKEKLEGFRNKATAKLNIPKYERIVFEKCEVI